MTATSTTGAGDSTPDPHEHGLALAKTELRRRYRQLRQELPAARRQDETGLACAVLRRLIIRHGVTALASYSARGGELDCDQLHRWWWGQGRPLYLPRALERGELSWHAVTGADDLEVGRFGIRQPRPGPAVALPEAALVVVPGVAFGRDGSRLGQGGGYYDRFLPRPLGLAVGVGFSCQACAGIPHGPHDQPVDVVVLSGACWRDGQAETPAPGDERA